MRLETSAEPRVTLEKAFRLCDKCAVSLAGARTLLGFLLCWHAEFPLLSFHGGGEGSDLKWKHLF